MRTVRRLGLIALLGALVVLGLPAFEVEAICAGGEVPPYYSEVCVPGPNIT